MSKSVKRVAAALAAAGLETGIRAMPEQTRTAAEAAAAVLQASSGNDDYFDSWLERGLGRGWRDGGASGAFRLVIDAGPANVAAFDAGWGDGVYAAYAGYDVSGRIAALVADFDILDWSKVRE